jgi:hypothetical protein
MGDFMSEILGLVVANSRKLGGRCLALIDLKAGVLVRPVSDTEHGELSRAFCMAYANEERRWIEPGDIVLMNLGPQQTSSWQRENHVVNPGDIPTLRIARETKAYSDIIELLPRILDAEDFILGGDIKYLMPNQVSRNSPSLEVRLVTELQIVPKVGSPGSLVANFVYRGKNFALPYTGGQKEINVGTQLPVAFICLSLGELFSGRHFKLVAGIMESLPHQVLGEAAKAKLMKKFGS